MLRRTSKKTSEWIIRKYLPCLSTVLLLILPVFAGDKQKNEDTFRQANLVLQGLIDSRNISPNILSKAIACSFCRT